MYLGNKLTEAIYDGVGCVITKDLTDRAVNNILLFGDSEVVVVLKGKYYGGVSTRGDELIPPIFDYICSITSGGENLYRLVYNGVDYDAIEYINLAKEKFGYPESEIQNENTENSGEENNDENNNQESNNSGEGEQGGENSNQEASDNQGEGETNNDEQTMNNQAVEAFNAQFQAYNGERSKGTTKSLLDIVSSSNTLSEQKVTIEYEGNLYTDDVSGLKDALTNNTYNVSIEYDNESGYINKIIIK